MFVQEVMAAMKTSPWLTEYSLPSTFTAESIILLLPYSSLSIFKKCLLDPFKSNLSCGLLGPEIAGITEDTSSDIVSV